MLRAFLVDGRLVSIPAQEKRGLVVLRYLANLGFMTRSAGQYRRSKPPATSPGGPAA